MAIETLWIPEKPSVAKELAGAIARIKRTRVANATTVMRDGFIQLDSGDVICSVFGHMLRMLPPSAYLSKEQNADLMSALPLIPEKFQFEPIPEMTKGGEIQMKGGKPVASKRYTLLANLIRKAKNVVNACDIDREGQLIFDELMEYIGQNPHKPGVMRASIVDMTDAGLDKAVRGVEKNGQDKWVRRGRAAGTRQTMDWLLGMNASMAYQVVTGVRTMSVGRVQTPVLALVVRRDLEIENFKPKTYYVPVIVMRDGTRMRWEKRHGAEGQDGFDANGRIIERALAQAIVDRIRSGLAGSVIEAVQEEHKEAPPLPFSMGALQSEASKRLGLTVAEVTKAAQNLYEKHKAITYVGTDCRFLPETMHGEASGILEALSRQYRTEAHGANPKLQSKAFNDGKVDEHFAIIPTGKPPALGAGDHAERGVFDVIARRYMAQFYPEYREARARVAAKFDQDEFRATASEPLALGWKEVEGTAEKGKAVAKKPGETEVEIEAAAPGQIMGETRNA